jgi:hypothetical protein
MGKKLTLDEFVHRAKKKHKNKYSYANSVYNGTKSDISIICPTHGEFKQRVADHIEGCGCPKCDVTLKLSDNNFIERSAKLHKNRYTYDLVQYGINNYDKVIITCKEHGNFEQTPSAHLRGQGCPKCFGSVKRTNEIFIEDARKIHGDKFDYSLVNYISNKKKVDIICKTHGVFSQRVSVHLDGFGCKQCKSSSRGEKAIAEYLKRKKIKFDVEKRFDDCRNTYPLPFDFWLPEHNTLIEYDGIQHFEVVEWFGGQERFDYTKKNDEIKTQYCLDNGIKLIRVAKGESVVKCLKVIS